jgi:hypothetical protein
MSEENAMASIEQSEGFAAARREDARIEERMGWGAQWVGSLRSEPGHDCHSSLRPEDVARSEVYYRSTGCWV